MVGLKNGHIRKNLTPKVVNPRDIAGERKKKKKKKKKNVCDGRSKRQWYEEAGVVVIVSFVS